MVESCILDNFEADESPLAIARMFSLPVDVVRRVLQFACKAELQSIVEARRKWPLPREYQFRADVLTRKLADIEKALRRSRKRAHR